MYNLPKQDDVIPVHVLSMSQVLVIDPDSVNPFSQVNLRTFPYWLPWPVIVPLSRAGNGGQVTAVNNQHVQ